MSCTSSVNARKEKRVLWLDTYYFSFELSNISNTNFNKTIWISKRLEPRYVPVLLEFHLVQISEFKFEFICKRILKSIPEPVPSGYRLQIHCSINACYADLKVMKMKSCDYDVSQPFLMDVSDRPFFMSSDFDEELQIKVLVNMTEYDCASGTTVHFLQEREFEKIWKKYFNNEDRAKDLCSILRIKRLRNIFTGRQNNEFAERKRIFIERTDKYLDDIISYTTAKDACVAESSTIDLGLILNYILNAGKKEVNDNDLLEVYYEAYRLGLDFLIDLSRDVILNRIGNRDFMIDALKAADCVGDGILFEKIAEQFIGCSRAEEFNKQFAERVKSFAISGNFMVLSLTREFRKRRLPFIYPATEDLQQQSTSKVFV